MWIGIDDTDSRNGGCTTYLALALINNLAEKKYDIIGYPRLIRLNPNIPWKTRGNGAISIQIGKGKGKKIKIGEMNGKNIFSYLRKSNDSSDYSKVRKIVEKLIDSNAKLEDKNTNSGFVLLDKQPKYNTYEKTVKQIVNLKETEELLNLYNADFKGYKNRRGLIGATASVAWKPKDKTYELITYRERKKWGTKRNVDENSTKNMDKKYSSTFDNFDYENNHNRLVPNSPCPVLYGIRGNEEKELLEAKSLIISEKVDGWLIFKTNQGTDEHLEKTTIDKIIPYKSVIVKGTVNTSPNTIQGGHVIFTIKDSTGEIDCAAYEPTKQFRDIIRSLITGDEIEVYGGVRKEPLTINIEKIRIINLEKQIQKIENPVCPKCGKHMKSKGTKQGYKCIICGLKSNEAVYKEKKRSLKIGFYEVPVCARRHLSKPLKRMTTP